MRFLWPEALVLAAAVPVFLAFYIRLEKRKRAAARRSTALYARPAAQAAQRPLARHIPLALFLASLIALSLALARPQAPLATFAVKGTVVLALDVSNSMKADDVRPSRLGRAQVLAKEFVAKYSDEFRIGLVSFGANAVIEMEPITGREELFTAIDRLAIQRGTAIGSGIITALAMIFPEADMDGDDWVSGYDAVLPAGGVEAGPGGVEAGLGNVEARPGSVETRPGSMDTGPLVPGAAPAPGTYSAAAVILFSDGQTTAGTAPLEAARLAASLGVRIHAIGVGSSEGKPMRIDGWAMRTQLDEAALRRIATMTHGEYVGGRTPIDWQRIVDSIRPELPPEALYTEITALFAAAAAVAAMAAAMLSLLRTQRVL